MTTLQQLQIAQDLLATGLVKKVYHSCQLVQNQQRQRLYAAYQRGNQYIYAGVDDTKGMFAYIRSNGDIKTEVMREASCGHSYNVQAPLRVVVFHDEEPADFQWLIERLSTFTFRADIFLQRIITDRWRLQNEESDQQRVAFKPNTFYIAFDISVNFVLLRDHCNEATCPTFPNPIC